MPNNSGYYQGNSQKISEFNSQSLIQDTDLFTFVRSATNFNISWAKLKLDLGVTGSLTPVGAPTATPVLQQVGQDYFIRGVETNKGVASTLSAQNGVQLSCNFAQVGAGAEIIKDLNASQYEYKTLVGGQNVNITDTGDTLRFDFSTDITATKTVIVSEEGDFPTPVGGVITLTPDTDYLIVNDVTTTNRFVISGVNTIRAASSQLVDLTYTGSDTMFTGTDPNFKISDITINCPNGDLFDTTAPGGMGIVQMVESNVEQCQTLGTIDGNFITRFTNVAFENLVAGGLSFTGTHQNLVIDVGISFLGGGSLIDLGTATFQTISIEGGIIAASAPGTFFLSGLTNSGNIVSGGLGTVINNKGFGSVNSLNGISTDDARWNFVANNNIPDTRPDILLTFDTPTTTVLAPATPALINGAWTVQRSSQMTGTAAGRSTYDGEKPATLPITLTLSAEPVSGTNKDINIYLAKNGVVVTDSKVQTTISSGSPKNQSVVWQDVFNNNDYYEPFIESVDGTDVQVNTAKLRVN